MTSLRFLTPRADRAHNYLYARLNNSGDAAVRDAASKLHELRRNRNAAYYDLHIAFPHAEAARYVAMGNDVIRELDSMTPTTRRQITDAIKLYERGIGDVTWQP